MKAGRVVLLSTVAVVPLGALLWFLRAPPSTLDTPAPPTADGAPARRFAGDSVRVAQATGGTHAISGVVTGGDGPLSGLTVVAIRADSEEHLDVLRCATPSCGLETVHCPSTAAEADIAEWVQARRGEGPPVASATTRSDGAFTLSGLEPGAHQLWAFSDTLGAALTTDVSADTKDAVITFAGLEPVSGKLIGARDQPVNGVWVTAFLPAHPRYFEARTDHDGKFDFGLLPSDHLSLVATSGTTSAHVHLFRRRGSSASVLSVAPRAPLHVRVLREGRGVAGAEVTLHDFGHAATSRTDASGELALARPLAMGWSLAATDGQLGAVYMARGQTEDTVVLELAPSTWIRGRVTSDDGRPVAGARVWADIEREAVVSGADGEYRIGPLTGQLPGSLTVNAERSDLLPGTATAQLKEHAETVADLRLERGTTLEGVVQDPSGKAVAGAEVSIELGIGGRGVSGASAQPPKTDAQGHFRLAPVPAAELELRASHPAWVAATTRARGGATDVVIKLVAGASISGKVTDAAGKPVATEIQVVADADMRDRSMRGRDEERAVRSGVDGRFEVHGLPPGDWLMVVSRGATMVGSATASTTGTDTVETEIRLDQLGQISGIVVDTQGNPVADTLVSARSAEPALMPTGKMSRMIRAMPSRGSAQSGSDGRFVIPDLKAGSVEVSAIAGGQYPPPSQTVQVGATDIKLVVTVQVFVTGRVVDEAGARVGSFMVGGHPFQSGEFKLPVRDGQGRLELVISATGFAASTAKVPEAGNPRDVGTVVLRKGKSVHVTVVAQKGARPIEGALVSCGLAAAGTLGESGPPAGTNAKGEVTVENVRPEPSLECHAWAKGFNPGSAALSLDATAVTVTLAERMTGTIEGTYEGAQPEYGLSVEATMLDAGTPGYGQAAVEANGRFKIVDLDPGTYRVSSGRAPGVMPAPPQLVTVTAGETAQVHLVAPSGGVKVSVEFVDGSGQPVMMIGVIAPGRQPTPTTQQALSALRKTGASFSPMGGGGAMTLPGDATVVGITASEKGVSVFTQVITVSHAENQSFRIVVPAQLTELPRPPRPTGP